MEQILIVYVPVCVSVLFMSECSVMGVRECMCAHASLTIFTASVISYSEFRLSHSKTGCRRYSW